VRVVTAQPGEILDRARVERRERSGLFAHARSLAGED
jgi:hypothetical protein